MILDASGNPLDVSAMAAPAPTVPQVDHSGYNTPQDSRQRQWRPSQDRDHMDLISPAKRRAMQSDSRWLYATGGGLVSGAVKQKADYCVLNAWVPKYVGSDERFKVEIEPLMKQWQRTCSLRGAPFSWRRVLWLASKTLDVDGELFLRFLVRDDGWPVIGFYEGHRVGTQLGNINAYAPGSRFDGAKIRDGIIYGDDDLPAAYVFRTWDDDRVVTESLVDAINVLHVYDPEHFSQGRGIPALTSAVHDFYDVLDTKDATKIKVKLNSMLTLIESNETGTGPVNKAFVDAARSAGAAPQTMELWNGMIKFIRNGNSIKAHEADVPGSMWIPFMEFVLRGAFRGMNWPYQLAWDFAGLTGPSARAVLKQAERCIITRQSVLEDMARQMVLFAVSQFRAAGFIRRLPDDWDRWKFTMPPSISIDMGRERAADLADIEAGLLSHMDIAERQGQDLRELFVRKAESWRIAQEVSEQLGVPVAAIARFGDGVDQPATNE